MNKITNAISVKKDQIKKVLDLYKQSFKTLKLIDKKILGLKNTNVTFDINGTQLTLIEYEENKLPKGDWTISLMYECRDEIEYEFIKNKLKHNGNIITENEMDLEGSPTIKYVWVVDEFGVVWQLLINKKPTLKNIVPFIAIEKGKGKEVLDYYLKIFSNSKANQTISLPDGSLNISFTIEHKDIMLMEYDPSWLQPLTWKVSFMFKCNDLKNLQEIKHKMNGHVLEENNNNSFIKIKDKYGIVWNLFV